MKGVSVKGSGHKKDKGETDDRSDDEEESKVEFEKGLPPGPKRPDIQGTESEAEDCDAARSRATPNSPEPPQTPRERTDTDTDTFRDRKNGPPWLMVGTLSDS